MLGSMTETALVTGVPYPTIELWRRQDWWKEFALKLQSEDIQQMDSNLRRVIDKSLKAVEDRIDNGDALFDQKTGEIRRIPIKAQVALKITSELLTKRDKIQEAPHKEKIEETINARLMKLADEFHKLALDRSPQKHVLDIPMVEVVQQ